MRSTPTPKTIAAATAVLALTMAACSGGSDASDDSTPDAPAPAESAPAEPDTDEATDAAPAEGSATSVGIKSSRFDPLEISVAVGDTVTFTNNDPFAHTVTANDDQTISFDSGEFGQDETFEATFDEAGSFNYFCQIHPTMRATVVVG